MASKGLNRGLGALLGDFSEPAAENSAYRLLPLQKIEPNPDQPRQDFDQEALEALLPAGGSQDFFRITLNGYGEADLPGLQKKLSAFPNLQLIDKTEPPIDLWADADEDSLEGIYFQMLRTAMEEDPANAEHIQLAAEISRRILSGKEVIL